MVHHDLAKTPQSSTLLHKLIDHPQLPALVPQLKTPALTQLITTIGVEDSGPVIAHTTPQQLQRVFDEMLWSSLTPDSTERMSASAFVKWLQVMLEIGDDFLAERLDSLGIQFAVAQFAQQIEVHDLQDTLTMVDSAAEAFGNYRVLARNPEDWDVVRAALAAIDADVPDFLSAVLGNIATTVRYADIDRASVNASTDEAHDRDLRREQDGFVTRPGALEFLNTARTQPLDVLSDMSAYSRPVEQYMQSQRQAVEPSQPPMGLDPADLEELASLLHNTRTIERTMRLEHQGKRALPIKELMDQLEADDPDAFAERLAELVFLGNVLVAGSKDLGERFSEVEAANAALSTANLGASYLVSQHEVPVETLMLSTPGLIRAFSVGWHILHQVAGRTARALVTTLRAPDVRYQLLERQWILQEVDVAMADFTNNVDLAKFDQVRDSLAFASLVIEPEACARLKILISEFPRLPTEAVPGERVEVRAERIDGLDDLRAVDEFLQSLPKQIKL